MGGGIVRDGAQRTSETAPFDRSGTAPPARSGKGGEAALTRPRHRRLPDLPRRRSATRAGGNE
jgi:hypothetical protein